MSTIDETLKANKDYANKFELGSLPMPPARKLAIVACMDARLTVEQSTRAQNWRRAHHPQCGRYCRRRRDPLADHLALPAGHARIYGDQPSQSCGMLTFKDEDLKKKASAKRPKPPPQFPKAFHFFPAPWKRT